MNEVVKLVGKERRPMVVGVVTALILSENATASAYALRSKLHNRRLAREFAAAVRRMAVVGNRSPYRNELLPHLEALNGFRETWTYMATKEPRWPRSGVNVKRLAASWALFVCQQCGIEPTITKSGKFFGIAAALYGDTHADLGHHCRGVLTRAGANPRIK
jgi:hypothetical protein